MAKRHRISELTDEQCQAISRQLDERLRNAARASSHLLLKQLFISDANEDELRAALPAEEVDRIIAYRRDSRPSEIAPTPVSTYQPSWLRKAVDCTQRVSGMVNGISELVIGYGYTNGPEEPEPWMNYEGDADLGLVIFTFRRPIREAVLIRDGDLVLHGTQIAADTPLHVHGRDIVRNLNDRGTRWEFVEGLEWRIIWSITL